MWLPRSPPKDVVGLPTGSSLDEYSGQSAVVVSIAFAAVATALVAVRLVTRWRVVNNLGKDDLVITVSVRLWASIPLYNLSLTLTKISILLQYLRVFPGLPIRRACYILMAIVIAAGLWTVLTAILTCVPIAYNWDRSIKGGRCFPLKPLWFANATLNIATDFSILIVPMPVLKTLKLPRRQKIGLFAVFALGGFVCITSMLRLRSIYIASTSHDHTWDNVGAASWSAVEVNTGIICAALPTIKPLIARIFPRFLAHPSYIQTAHSRNSHSTPAAIFRASNSLHTTVGASGIPMRASQFASTWGHPGGIKVDFALTQEVERRDPKSTNDEVVIARSVASTGSLGGAASERESEADSEKGLVLMP